jgi:hypothetical protein
MLLSGIFMHSIHVIAQNAVRPIPNLSQMEQWYDISNLTYDKYGTIKMDVVAKNNPPQTHRIFVFKYFDTNGKEVGSYNIMGMGYSTPRGLVEHVESYGFANDKINTIKSVAVYLLNDDGTYTGPPRENIQQTNAPANTKTTSGTTSNNQITNCNYNVLPALNYNTAFSEALVKSALYERYSFEPNTGGLSSPLAVGITFSTISLLDSYKNTVIVVPGRGAQRKNDGAPVNATIYRFHAKYIVCRKYNNATRRTQYESDNVIFKASNGNWQSFTDSSTKTQEL